MQVPFDRVSRETQRTKPQNNGAVLPQKPYISPLTGKPCKSKPSKILAESNRIKNNPKKAYELQKKWRETHPDYRQNWKKNHPGVFVEYNKKDRLNHPDKFVARRKGRAKYYPRGGTCEICGSKVNLEGHHPDYTQPLLIQTLCMPCHKNIHATRRTK